MTHDQVIMNTWFQHHKIHLYTWKSPSNEQCNAGVTTCIEDRDGNIIMEHENILERWHEYISTLYDETRRGIPLISNDTNLSLITHTEIEYALKGMPMRKAPVPDDITTEMLVAAGGRGVTEITNLANMRYSEGRFPELMYKSIFITIPTVKGGGGSQMREESHTKFNEPCHKTSSAGDYE